MDDSEESTINEYQVTDALGKVILAVRACQSEDERDIEVQLGPSVVSLLRRLQELCSPHYSGDTDTMLWNTACLVAKMMASEPSKTVDLFWAMPGMTTFLLNLDLKSDTMRQRQAEKRPPTSKERSFFGFDPAFQLPYHFACLAVELLFGTMMSKSIKYRGTPVAAAATRKLMEIYKDPYTRVSMPWTDTGRLSNVSVTSPRNDMLPTIFSLLLGKAEGHVGDPQNKSNLIPGLSVVEAIGILADEPIWIQPYYKDGTLLNITWAIRGSCNSKPELMKGTADLERAVVAHKIVGRFVLPSIDERNSILDEELMLRGSLMMATLLANDPNSNFADASVWYRVSKLAMRNERPIGPYREYFENKFSQYCVEARAKLAVYLQESYTRGLPESLFPANNPSLVQHIVEFALEPWPNARE